MTSAFKLTTLAAATSLLAMGWSGPVWQATAQEPLPPPPPNGEAGPMLEALDLDGFDGPVLSDPEDPNLEVLNRGPMHEAFAEMYNRDPQPGLVVPRQPPEPINEIPPEARPEGEDVVWIPGYFAWDPDREDFLWVSGVWRNVPPEQRWVPGYWHPAEEEGGWRWVSGFWIHDEVDDLTYLPPPPESLETGPSVEAPSEDHFWVPGTWQYGDEQYQWRPGYWAPIQEDLLWIPDRYIWTPAGVCFAPGYWDYRLTHRGTLFAPVVFAPPVFAGPPIYYTPTVVINVGPILLHMWSWPAYHHYWYGDWYGTPWADWGMSPWFWHHRRAGWYDPFVSYYGWHFGVRGRFDYFGRMNTWFHHMHRNPGLRPPVRWRDQARFVERIQDRHLLQSVVLSERFDRFRQRPELRDRFRPVAAVERRDIAQASRRFHDFGEHRRQAERRAPAVRERARPQERIAPVLRERLPERFRDVGRIARPDRDARIAVPEARREMPARPGVGRAGVRPEIGRELPRPGVSPDRIPTDRVPPVARPDARERIGRPLLNGERLTRERPEVTPGTPRIGEPRIPFETRRPGTPRVPDARTPTVRPDVTTPRTPAGVPGTRLQPDLRTPALRPEQPDARSRRVQPEAVTPQIRRDPATLGLPPRQPQPARDPRTLGQPPQRGAVTPQIGRDPRVPGQPPAQPQPGRDPRALGLPTRPQDVRRPATVPQIPTQPRQALPQPQARPQVPQARPQIPQSQPQIRQQIPQLRSQAAPQIQRQAAPQIQRQIPQARPQIQQQARPQIPQLRQQVRPQARPQARPATPQVRPQARPVAPQVRPQARPSAPQVRSPARPQARPAAPQLRSSGRPAAPRSAPAAGRGGGARLLDAQRGRGRGR